MINLFNPNKTRSSQYWGVPIGNYELMDYISSALKKKKMLNLSIPTV